jgi:hypothetical protein
MTDFFVGPGVAAAMADHGDEARSDERFIINEPQGQRVSETYGRDNIYYWLEADNALRVVPFRG